MTTDRFKNQGAVLLEVILVKSQRVSVSSQGYQITYKYQKEKELSIIRESPMEGQLRDTKPWKKLMSLISKKYQAHGYSLLKENFLYFKNR